MRILYITNIPSPYRVDFFNQLGKMCELTVVFEDTSSSERDSSWRQYRFEHFQGIFCKGIKARADGRFSFTPLKHVRGQEYDRIVVCNAISLTGMLETTYMRLKKIPYWIEGDGAFVPLRESKWKYQLKKFMLKGAQGYWSTCENHTEYYLRYGAEASRIHRYPFSSVRDGDVLDVPPAPDRKRELRQKLGMTEKDIVVTVGQFIRRKGLDVLVKAVKLLDDPAIGFYFVGGEGIEGAERMGNVHVVSFQQKEALWEYYDAADVFVCPTREDIWGLVVNEAMARGLPVVTTTRCNAGLELVKDGENGYLVEPDDAGALADRIGRILRTDDREAMGRKAIEQAGHYTIEKMTERFL